MDAVAGSVAIADDRAVGEIVEVNDPRLGDIVGALERHTTLRLRLRRSRHPAGAGQRSQRDQHQNDGEDTDDFHSITSTNRA